MLNKYIFYISFIFISPVVALISLLDLSTNNLTFKENFKLIYGGIR
jgi:hypothetical protein